MLALIVIGGRLVQYVCAMILCGAPLLLAYGLPADGPGGAAGLSWPRPVLSIAASGLAAAAVVSFCAQTAVMAGSATAAFEGDALWSVLTASQFGAGTATRLGLALLAALTLRLVKPWRGLWPALSALGVAAALSFAWTGHGASDEGLAGVEHLAADALHLMAAAVWLGALAAFCLLLAPRAPRQTSAAPEDLALLHRALTRFSGVGSAAVAVLIATGLVNTAFLVGLAHLPQLVSTPYGLLLSAKVVLFVVMLGLAAANRFRLTPRLGRALDDPAPADAAVCALRRSVMIETAIGGLVLVIVSVLGTLAPLSSS